MNKEELLAQMLERNNGILKTSDVIDAGISKTYFMAYAKKIKLERVFRGVYLSPDAWTYHFYLVQLIYPKIVFSHETTAYLLDMTEREPFQYTITVKTGYNAPTLKAQNVNICKTKRTVSIRCYRSYFSWRIPIENIYNANRTLCNFIRNHSQIEVQEFQTVLKEYVKRKEKNLPQLMRYAKDFM